MKIVLLTKYSSLGASSRLRSLQYLPALEQVGIDVTSYPLFDDVYLRRLYTEKRRSVSAVALRYAKRIYSMCTSAGADLIWIEYEALPYVPFRVEQALLPRAIPWVADYDDAVFHNYDRSANAHVRRLLGRKIDSVMSRATTVICGNEYLANRARCAGALHVEKVPTVVDVGRYKPVPEAGNASPVIGWIGSPSTQHYVVEMQAVFERLHRIYGIRLVLVGAQPEIVQRFGPVPIEVLPWSEATEARFVEGFDIGIMPLVDGPWERGKCGYKLIQYMACAKPVVASPVGVNVEIVQGGNCGLLADGYEQWFRALGRLICEPGMRKIYGRRGRRAVEDRFSLQAQSPRIIEILSNAATRKD